MRAVSVIVCAHNPRRDYLVRVLGGLRSQTLPLQAWELVLVDNGSKRCLAPEYDLAWHPSHVHAHEPQIGLTHARLCGMRRATGELLVFVDDDNVLPPDYLERALAIAQMHPQLGVFGAGTIEPEFEVRPAATLEPVLHMLSIRAASCARWTKDVRDVESIPWGAGLCVTRHVAAAYTKVVECSTIVDFLDRRGEQLFAGGDDLFSWVSARLGRAYGTFSDLRLSHLIRAERLTEQYLLRLLHNHALSHGVLGYVFHGTQPGSLTPWRAMRIAMHGVRRGRFSMRCRWATATGSSHAVRVIREHALPLFDWESAVARAAGTVEG